MVPEKSLISQGNPAFDWVVLSVLRLTFISRKPWLLRRRFSLKGLNTSQRIIIMIGAEKLNATINKIRNPTADRLDDVHGYDLWVDEVKNRNVWGWFAAIAPQQVRFLNRVNLTNCIIEEFTSEYDRLYDSLHDCLDWKTLIGIFSN